MAMQRPASLPALDDRVPDHTGTRSSSALYDEAQAFDRTGRMGEAVAAYEAAIDAAERDGVHLVLIDALRRVGIARHRRHERAEAHALCTRSHDIALVHGEMGRAAEALNALAGFELEHGATEAACELFDRALHVGAASPGLRGRIEQNLGVVANIRGDLDAAYAHYSRALAAYDEAGDARAHASMHINLGMVSADREQWADADRYYQRFLASATARDDPRVRALALMNHTEVFLAWERYADARTNAEAALAIFDQLGDKRHKSETYKILGVVYRETGRSALAETRLCEAVKLAGESNAVLEEAEATRELALLYQRLSRNQDALRLLSTAHQLFQRLDARRDMVDVNGKMADLEGTYRKVVRDWGQSIESADSYTHGHCERVASYAAGVAEQLGLGADERTAIRLGAYLHDVGKVKTPHEILNKPGRLTDDEFVIMQRHPVDGVELLAGVEFPWEIKPIIRWHHEKFDGTGYPDRLKGNAIPLAAQIICVADVWDALTTTRSYRTAMPHERAMAIMHEESRRHWRPDVFAAFDASLQARGPGDPVGV